MLNPDGTTTATTFSSPEELEEWVDDKYATASETIGDTPNIHSGGIENISTSFAVESGRMATAISGLTRIGRYALRVAGPLGAISAVAEAGELNTKLDTLIERGLVPEEARLGYQAVLTAHTAQGACDPTGVGGEVVVQTAYDAWLEEHKLQDSPVSAALEPSSLIEDIRNNGSPPDDLGKRNVSQRDGPGVFAEKGINMPSEGRIMAAKGIIMDKSISLDFQEAAGECAPSISPKIVNPDPAIFTAKASPNEGLPPAVTDLINKAINELPTAANEELAATDPVLADKGPNLPVLGS